MGKGKRQKTKANPDQQPSKNHDIKMKNKAGLNFFDIAIPLLATVFLGFGFALFSDAQFRSPGIFFVIGGITTAACWCFVHVRHRWMEIESPAVAALVLFAITISSFVTLGASQWWFIANKDVEVFNAITATRIVNSPSRPEAMTVLLTVVEMPSEFIAHRVHQLVHLQITNRTNIARRIVGISADLGQESWWWPTWRRLCPVDLFNSQLLWAFDFRKAILLSSEYNLENKIRDKPIPPNESISGWMAFECPKDFACSGNAPLRIGILDASGVTSWLVMTSPAIPPTLQDSFMRSTGQIDLTTKAFRPVSSCRK
jgi:hypothetical protein